jgi:hypothetical protein
MSIDLQGQCCDLVNILNQGMLNESVDRSKWKWTKNRSFIVKSFYKEFCRNGIDRSFRHLWKRKIPLKIKVWLWLIWHNAIANKDNLLRGSGMEIPSVSFAMTLNLYCIFFLLPYRCIDSSGPLHSFFGGCHSFLELAAMC